MKWIMISDPASAVHVFNLMEGNVVKEVVRYNPLQKSARISCQGRQRVFFIEQLGFRNQHFGFKNEYGFLIGRLSIESLDTEGGMIEIEGKKFQYQLVADPDAALLVYQPDQVAPVVTCSFLNKSAEAVPLVLHAKETIHEYASLLLGLCWYLYSPVVAEPALQYELPVHSFA